MALGTITVTNNSTAVVGVGTTFTDYAPGSFITLTLVGVPYTIAVDEVTDDTHLSLMLPFDGPTTADAAFEVTGVNSMALATMGVTTQAQRALRMLLTDQANWRQIFSMEPSITITLPSGQQLTGMSWGYISQQLADLDIDEIIAARDETYQARDDAQVAQAAAETAEGNAANSASASATSAGQSASSATAAADSATAASNSAGESAGSATAAADSAATASTEADRAEAAAGSVDVAALLRKDDNLESLTDKASARNNLDVFSKAEIQDRLAGYLGQVDWQEMRTALEPGTIPRDGQEVDQTGVYADLYAKIAAGKLPTCTETEWWADPLNRGCYVLNSSAGKMRLPDDNGVQAGSLKIPVHVGDGGMSANNGKMGASALPNIKGTFYRMGSTSSLARTDSVVDGAFELLERETQSPPTQAATIAAFTTGVPLRFNAKLSNGIYDDGVTEVRANRIQGCWTVRIAATATNGGSIDALALATAIASGDAALAAQIVATNARIDYALISPATNPALNSRTVFENPFGINTPVLLTVDFQLSTNSKWVQSFGYFYSTSNRRGIVASYSEGEGIVLMVGQHGLAEASVNNGDAAQNAASYNTVSPVRIHVWKITA